MLDVTQSRKYFEARLKGQLRGRGPEVKVRCLFHDDRNPSLSINLDKGTWKCFAGCGEGGILDFEERFSKCDRDTAKRNVSEILGQNVFGGTGTQPAAVYPYRDARGQLAFEKLRYEPKRFLQRKPNGKGGYDYKLGDIRKPLYRLPELLTAKYIVVCEGEKDCDNVRVALGANEIATTTNFDGAGKWRDDDSVYFAGKQVVILPDNDEIGRQHAQKVAASVYPYAVGIRIANLSGLKEHQDVSDYLASGHSGEELLQEMQKASQWFPPQQSESQKLFVPAPAFIAQSPQQIDWLVEGLIERGANGFLSAVPKGGKSWAAIDLSISMALGCPWLGFRVPAAVRVALISREDNPSLTAWRLKHLYVGKSCGEPGLIEENLHLNSRRESAELMLDNPDQMSELMAALKLLQPQFAIFDVFNVLHCADENDNQEMRAVLRQLSAVQAEIGCGIGVVHHYNKADQGSMTQRLRGSSAIAGWAEWLIGISVADEETKTRRMEFELKAAQPPDPIFFRIESMDESARLSRVDAPSGRGRAREGVAAESYMQ